MTKKSFRVAVVLPCNQSDSRARLFGVLDFFADKNDVETVILDASSPRFRNECKRITTDCPLHGIIFSYPRQIDSLMRRFKARPALAMLDGPRDFSPVDVDIRLSTQQITDSVAALLRRHGYEVFAFCGTDNPQDVQYSRETEAHFAQSAGSDDFAGSFRESPTDSMDENLKRGAEWVASLPKPCGIMCYSDQLARYLLNACKYSHIHVPEQVAIIGMDDTPDICEMTRPTLSSTLPDFEKSGYLAAEALYLRLHRRKASRSITKFYGLKTITERESTSDLRGCGRIVTKAINIIRHASLDVLSAEYVSRELKVSRRLLELHFKKVVGRGVHAEITQRRLETIYARLQSSWTPIDQLCEECGYRTTNAARIAFRKRYGKTMQDVRQPKSRPKSRAAFR